MAVDSYKELLRHTGHKIVVAHYGTGEQPQNVAIECEDCSEVLVDYDRPEPVRITVEGGVVVDVEGVDEYEIVDRD